MKPSFLFVFRNWITCCFLCLSGNIIAQSTWDYKVNKQNKQDEKTCDYIVSTYESQKMIENFKRQYKPENVPGLTTECWIDKCALISLYNHISATPDLYDGIRIYWCDSYRSSILIVPTSPVNPPSDKFKHLNRPDIPVRDVCRVSNPMINNEPAIFNNRTNDFGENFRKESRRSDRSSANKDSLSLAIWLDKCVLKDIILNLNDPQKNLDGMIAYAAAYSGKDERSNSRGQFYLNQSTIILIPSKSTDAGHEPQWEIFNSKKEPFVGFNHGQLCPQICD